MGDQGRQGPRAGPPHPLQPRHGRKEPCGHPHCPTGHCDGPVAFAGAGERVAVDRPRERHVGRHCAGLSSRPLSRHDARPPAAVQHDVAAVLQPGPLAGKAGGRPSFAPDHGGKGIGVPRAGRAGRWRDSRARFRFGDFFFLSPPSRRPSSTRSVSFLRATRPESRAWVCQPGTTTLKVRLAGCLGCRGRHCAMHRRRARPATTPFSHGTFCRRSSRHPRRQRSRCHFYPLPSSASMTGETGS